jgi:hypothetical protein
VQCGCRSVQCVVPLVALRGRILQLCRRSDRLQVQSREGTQPSREFLLLCRSLQLIDALDAHVPCAIDYVDCQ